MGDGEENKLAAEIAEINEGQGEAKIPRPVPANKGDEEHFGQPHQIEVEYRENGGNPVDLSRNTRTHF